MSQIQEQAAREQITERRERKRAARLALVIVLPFALVFVGGCVACVALAV